MKPKRQKQLEALQRLLASIEQDRRNWTVAGAELAALKIGNLKRDDANARFIRYTTRLERQEQEALRLRELTGVSYTSTLDMRASSIGTADRASEELR